MRSLVYSEITSRTDFSLVIRIPIPTDPARSSGDVGTPHKGSLEGSLASCAVRSGRSHLHVVLLACQCADPTYQLKLDQHLNYSIFPSRPIILENDEWQIGLPVRA